MNVLTDSELEAMRANCEEMRNTWGSTPNDFLIGYHVNVVLPALLMHLDYLRGVAAGAASVASVK